MKNNSTKFLILSIILMVVCIFIFVFFIKIIKNKNIHTSSVFSVLESKMIDKENLEVIKDRISEIEDMQRDINTHFINKNDADIFVEYLESLGRDNGSKLNVTDVLLDEKDPNFINFKVEINGDFNNILKTVYNIENSNYIININSIYLNKNLTPIIKSTETEFYPWTANVSFSVISMN